MPSTSLPFLSPGKSYDAVLNKTTAVAAGTSWLHTYFHSLALKYGPIFKLRLGAKTAVVASSPEVAREILKTHDVTFANHDVPVAARVNSYGGEDVLWSPYGPHWRKLRKVCVLKMLSHATLDSFYGLRRREIRQNIRYLWGRARAGSPVNLGEQIFLTVFNVVTQMLWGATVEGEEERENLAAELRRLVTEMSEIEGLPNISDFFPGLSRFDIQGLAKRMGGPAKRMDRMFDRVIDQRLRTVGDDRGDGQDFLQFLLKVKDEDEKTPLSMNHVKALLMDMILGGTDTSANTIEFAMAEVISKPEMMKKAQQELDEVVGKDNIVEESHIPKLPYLLALMKETLRLHPTFPLLVPRRPSESVVVSGYDIPKDSCVFINAWAIHRDPNAWENPSEFNPDRFLENPNDFSGNDFRYIPFGSGRRICAGIAMAERTVLYNLATLLHSFDWKVREGERVEVEEIYGIPMKLKNPLMVIPVPRLSYPNLYL
ncbi:PREDICTED: cytochrome P450 93A3-like [Tarenaya hassleriana]|uniref:cytochrome P450 93A3-like n=1 Tax=Tarenaya hassleriana TaxID=28532 RepID=UPI0008FD09F8|nr:PREDICTED: cytochrome P450 93A3-like [Tarenaya hassleriana]